MRKKAGILGQEKRKVGRLGQDKRISEAWPEENKAGGLARRE